VTYPAAVGMARAKLRARELLNEALDALKPFGPSAEPLREIATFIVARAMGEGQREAP
jgi:geranylgeranyl diphosphate synthase type II